MWSTVALRPGESQLAESPEVLRWQFFRGLRASKLLMPEDVDLFEREAHNVALEEVQQALVDRGALTPYQLRRIRDGAPTGLVLAQYRVLDEIGSGGFGQVFKATHAVMNRMVALKLMTPDRYHGRLFRDVFFREVAAVTRLSHPNVVLTFDANEIDGVLFLAMEYIEGPTLHALVCDNGPPDVPLAASIMLQLASGVRHAHEAGLVHRDLKPANVLVQPDPQFPSNQAVLVKVIDFGLARLQARDGCVKGTLLADPGALVGTPAFMAPEQAVNFHDADARSDLYSLGCTFYFLLTGRLPFEAQSCQRVLELHATRRPKPLCELRPDVPTGLVAVINRLMAKNPNDRYQSADELCTALTAFVSPPGFTGSGGYEPTDPFELEVRVAPSLPPTPLTEIEPAPTVPAFERPTDTDVSDGTARRLWLEWCAVIEALAHGGRPDVSAAQYSSLYKNLVRSLNAADGTELGRLRNVVEPWVTLRALWALDRDAVADLWQTCQKLGAIFAPDRPRPARARGPIFAVLVLLFFVGAVGIGANWTRVLAFLTRLM